MIHSGTSGGDLCDALERSCAQRLETGKYFIGQQLDATKTHRLRTRLERRECGRFASGIQTHNKSAFPRGLHAALCRAGTLQGRRNREQSQRHVSIRRDRGFRSYGKRAV